MHFTTPRTREEEQAIKDYMAEHPYAPFIHPTQQDINEAKALLQTIKQSRVLKTIN